MTPESLNSLKLMMEADCSLLQTDYEQAIKCYSEAITWAERAPESDPLFDRELMIAYCNAGMSGAYVRQGKYIESLASAERSTSVLEEKFNTRTLCDAERLSTASMSKARALIGLGRVDEAKMAFDHANNILGTSEAWSYSDREEFLKLAKELEKALHA
jgi:tetratricopeptide (TPR) repeat protein